MLQNQLKIFVILTFSICSLVVDAQTASKYIVIDQFGYFPNSRKIAVIRDPQVGFDAAESFTPGASYALVNTATGLSVYSAAPVQWNGGATDNSSGDKAWWFDFSSVTTPGTYFVLDINNNVKSFTFDISPTVFNEVLKHAVRYFFYQRAGFPKDAKYAGVGWADGASHIGPLQDKNARAYNLPTVSSKEKILYGAWFDAGDFHRYTNWTANYATDFMRAYMEAPTVWADDYNIPESGNGIPDLLDEAKWGLDHLLRMQQSDGSVLSLLVVDGASPPSSATGQSLYTPASTSATLNTGGAFAAASKVYGSIGMTAYSDTLKARAIKAWDWAVANPKVAFFNTLVQPKALAGGEQEYSTKDNNGNVILDTAAVSQVKLETALFLFEITGDVKYKTFFDAYYSKIPLIAQNYGSLFQITNQEVLLHYAKLSGATPSVATTINNAYKKIMDDNDQFKSYTGNIDPYVAPISFYGWGTNSIKAAQGLMFMDAIYYNIYPTKNDTAIKAAEGYLHYLHGVNPFNMTYISNMYAYGAEKSVTTFFHTWFCNGSPKWDQVGVSTYGPPPGYLTGGANPGYNWATDHCPGPADCNTESLTPPKGQPDQKSYKDFNTSWPLNSWEVTENSDAYQINYVRLLSKFISKINDCNGTLGGTASYDVCGQCTGGTTGLTPTTDASTCKTTGIEKEKDIALYVYPNPTEGTINIRNEGNLKYQYTITNVLGKVLISDKSTSLENQINMGTQPEGIYLVNLTSNGYSKTIKLLMK